MTYIRLREDILVSIKHAYFGFTYLKLSVVFFATATQKKLWSLRLILQYTTSKNSLNTPLICVSFVHVHDYNSERCC